MEESEDSDGDEDGATRREGENATERGTVTKQIDEVLFVSSLLLDMARNREMYDKTRLLPGRVRGDTLFSAVL